MSFIAMLMILAMGCVGVLFAGVMIVAAVLWVRGWRRGPVVLAGAMIGVGIVGFLGQAFSAVGGLNWLPQTFEWPAGSVEGVITTSSGFRVVPTTAAGRVQVYDGQWNFIRGWHVGPGASGAFALRPLENDHFEVITARGNHRHTFTIDGELVSEGTYSGGQYAQLSNAGEPAVVPTPAWLWVFTNPLHAWLVLAGGFAIFGLQSFGRKRDGTSASISNSVR